uniref:Uncharacterized protein n=1 Tax=Rhodnius prolixus TaxID=13249 RepID=T1IBP9_RHOPR
MSDSFFGFDASLDCDALDDGLLSEEDEEDYDALNDETFGESVITGDWEEDHEKLVEITEQSRHGLINEVGLIMTTAFKKFLSYMILKLKNATLPS